jgi:hypothetical protein
VSKKKKKPRRKKLPYPRPENLAARASGVAINENRRGTLMRLMDTAIYDRFFERDPFVIHLLVCASYMVLADLGRKSGKGPVIEKDFGRFSMTPVFRELGELRSAVSVERVWEDVFPSRADPMCLELGRASRGTKGPYDGGPQGGNS